jgi:hypothetical protein
VSSFVICMSEELQVSSLSPGGGVARGVAGGCQRSCMCVVCLEAEGGSTSVEP